MLLISPAALPREVLGEAVQVLLSTSRNALTLASVYAFVGPPAVLGQIAFKRDHKSRPLGYVTWAFLTDEVIGQLGRDPLRRLDFPEWNEGVNLFIADIVSLDGDIRGLLQAVQAQCPRHDIAQWRSRSGSDVIRAAKLR